MGVEEVAQKVAVLEEGQRNIIRSLATGDKRFETMFSMITDINNNVIGLIHTVNGNGQPGLCQRVELQTTSITEIEKRCATRQAAIDKEAQEKEELKTTVNKHENFFQQATGVMHLFKWIGYGGLAGIVIFVCTMIVMFARLALHF